MFNSEALDRSFSDVKLGVNVALWWFCYCSSNPQNKRNYSFAADLGLPSSVFAGNFGATSVANNLFYLTLFKIQLRKKAS